MKPGDTVTVRFTISGPNAINKLPTLKATVLSVEGSNLRVRYAEDAEMFAGLIGLIRLPRTSQGHKRTG
jgi:hypothetical protein